MDVEGEVTVTVVMVMNHDVYANLRRGILAELVNNVVVIERVQVGLLNPGERPGVVTL